VNFLTSDNYHLSEPTTPPRTLAKQTHQPALDVDAAVARYLKAAISDNTQRAYASDLRHFLAWGGGVPATERLVAAYLAAHAGSLSIATLTRRLATISKAHKMKSLPSPTSSELVRMTMQGIRRGHGKPQRRVAAAVKTDILAMVAPLGGSLRERRDRALILIGFAGAFRRSELCAINCTDVERLPEGIVIALNRSKTDQESRGRRVAIPNARSDVCPVRALDEWLSAAGIKEGAVFRSVNRLGRTGASVLCDRAVASIVKKLAAAAGLDPSRYSGHSLRAGFATSAAVAGLSSWKIRAQTGHASDSMLQRYIRDGELFVGNAAGAVL